MIDDFIEYLKSPFFKKKGDFIINLKITICFFNYYIILKKTKYF